MSNRSEIRNEGFVFRTGHYYLPPLLARPIDDDLSDTNYPSGLKKAIYLQALGRRDKNVEDLHNAKQYMYADLFSMISEESKIKLCDSMRWENIELLQCPKSLMEEICIVHQASNTGSTQYDKLFSRRFYNRLRQLDKEPLASYLKKTQECLETHGSLGQANEPENEQAIDFLYNILQRKYSGLNDKLVYAEEARNRAHEATHIQRQVIEAKRALEFTRLPYTSTAISGGVFIDNPITLQSLKTSDDIYGVSVASRKGKTVHTPSEVENSRINLLPVMGAKASPHSWNQTSRREALVGRKMSYSRDLRVGFLDYVQLVEPVNMSTHNSLALRTSGGVALLPSSNSSGAVKFLLLDTGAVVLRSKFTLLPMPDHVINHLTALAAADKKTVNKGAVSPTR